VHCEIGLPVAVEIQAPHHHWTIHWLFENSGANFVSLPNYGARNCNIQRNHFHRGVLTSDVRVVRYRTQPIIIRMPAGVSATHFCSPERSDTRARSMRLR
jgi:hypothetical protein